MRVTFPALSCLTAPTRVERSFDLSFPHYKVSSSFSHLIIQLFYNLSPSSLIMQSFHHVAFSLLSLVIPLHPSSYSPLLFSPPIIQSPYHVVSSLYSPLIICPLITQSLYHILSLSFSSFIISSPYHVSSSLYSSLIILFSYHIVPSSCSFFIIQFPYYVVSHPVILSLCNPLMMQSF